MNTISGNNYEDFNSLSKLLRKRIIETSAKAKIPHLGSCLSCLEILIFLYWKELKINVNDPEDIDRDRFLLSKGHAAPALFQVLAERGFYKKDLLNDIGESGSVFHEHPPKPGFIPGVEAATGSLGHGMPMALGMAMAANIKHQQYRSYALISDGECNEGSIWEAAMLAGSLKLANLTVLIDFNKWQATGRSEDIMALEPLQGKWKSFGWHTQEIDGHNFTEINTSLNNARLELNKPSLIVAHTIKGKGISFMEDDNNWHYRTPNEKELHEALKEL